ncbi:MAG TPA: hypothetical protein VKH45_09815 [Candidatus Acidoferrum sp.]|nr:hypothetical protein [Candidatus Acidoferrum sp.]
MRVLVTFAVDAEFAPWRKLQEFKKTKLGNCGIWGFTCTLGEKEVQVFLTGMGTKTCQQSLARYDFGSAEKPDLIISAGLAGALTEQLKPGDTIVPERVRTLDNDADAQVDELLREKAVLAGGMRLETLITAMRIVQTVVEKKRLSCFGQAVDMESAYIMTKSVQAKIPCVTIRTISDSFDEDLPIDFDRCFTPEGAVKPMNLLHAIVERPSGLPKLIRFGKQSNQAAHKLIDFLNSFVVGLDQVRVGMR